MGQVWKNYRKSMEHQAFLMGIYETWGWKMVEQVWNIS
jgi:hypothetical protein